MSLGISQSFGDFDRNDVKMMIFHKISEKIAEILQIMRNFLEKILKICPKKMYTSTLNRYGGNRRVHVGDRAEVLRRQGRERRGVITNVVL